jgi:hypothetical protein
MARKRWTYYNRKKVREMAKRKMKEYAPGENDTAVTEESSAAAIEHVEDHVTDDLVPDPEVSVQTGDEDNPVSSPDHRDSMKHLFDKSRKNRALVQRQDGEDVPDVAMVQKLVEEASGGKDDGAGNIDTNRDREEGDEPEVSDAFRKQVKETLKTETRKSLGLPEPETPDLPETDPSAIVTVKILGKEYDVPQQDLDDAGGAELYQKTRTANIKLQRIATRERALTEQEAAIIPREEQQANPSPDGQGKADDVTSLRDEVLDVLAQADGDDLGAVDEVLKRALSQRPTQQDTPTEPPPPARAAPPTETEQTLYQQREDDRLEANAMMTTDYRDIMNDPELQALAQQRFRMLATDPLSEGRSTKEMARESAEYVRSLGRRLITDPPPGDAEIERRSRVERKRKLPQPSRADASVSSSQKPDKTVPSHRDHIQRLRRRAGQDLSSPD